MPSRVTFCPSKDIIRCIEATCHPGVVGQARLARRGPVANYYQPVKFAGPEGVQFALAQNGAFGESEESLMAGLLIGSVYRFQITHIPGAEGVELYPTVELIDRTYPPANLATLYPIPIVVDESDLEAAMDGRMVTRSGVPGRPANGDRHCREHRPIRG